MDDRDSLDLMNAPTTNRPLLGLTILLVEDSRFACEAMRLLCIRSGARLRRADCLRSARRHLRVYRPSVAIVDMGLPDGSGADLIAELAQATPRVSAILGTSGDDFAEGAAIAAGADGFLPKPVTALAAFQDAVLSRLPAERRPAGPRLVPNETVRPDRVAFRDDMVHVADLLSDDTDARTLDYVAQFLTGVARSAEDRALLNAAEALGTTCEAGRPGTALAFHIAGLVQERLAARIAI